MDITINHLTNGKGGGATSFNTTSTSPASNKLILVFVTQDYDSSISPNTPTLSGCGLTWELVATKLNSFNQNGDQSQRVSLFRSMGSPSSGQITIDCAGQNQQSIFWGVTEFGNVDTTGLNGINAVVQSATKDESNADPMSMTLTLAAFGSSRNWTYAALIFPENNNPGTIPTGFTSIFSDAQDLGPDDAVRAVYKPSPSTSTTFTSTGGGAETSTGLACEIKANVNSGSAVAVL